MSHKSIYFELVFHASQILFLQQIESGKQLEAFSIQLVILAIWKQALHICHTQAASAMEGSPSHDTTRFRRSTSKKHSSSDLDECLSAVSTQGPEDISSQIEREFLREVEHAEELANIVDPGIDSVYFHYSYLLIYFVRPIGVIFLLL